jgi:hypothetical protein
MLHNIHRWEREGGVSERHKLHYCRAFGITPAQFGPRPEGYPGPGVTPGSAAAMTIPAAAAVLVPAQAADGIPGLPGPHLPAPAAIAYRGRQEPDLGHFAVEQEVLMTAATTLRNTSSTASARPRWNSSAPTWPGYPG